MRILEVNASPSPAELLGLVEFLDGRANDTNAQKKISQDAFISLAQSLGLNVNRQNLANLVNQPPLSNVLEPFDPGSGEIVFKGGGSTVAPKMPVNRAQEVVAKAARSAMKKDRGV